MPSTNHRSYCCPFPSSPKSMKYRNTVDTTRGRERTIIPRTSSRSSLTLATSKRTRTLPRQNVQGNSQEEVLIDNNTPIPATRAAVEYGGSDTTSCETLESHCGDDVQSRNSRSFPRHSTSLSHPSLKRRPEKSGDRSSSLSYEQGLSTLGIPQWSRPLLECLS